MPLDRIPLLSEREKDVMLGRWNTEQRRGIWTKGVVDMIVERCGVTGDAKRGGLPR